MKPEPINNKKMWGYFAPDGALQVRSLAYQRKVCREMICNREWNTDGRKTTYKDYEKAGYVLKKVLVNIEIL